MMLSPPGLVGEASLLGAVGECSVAVVVEIAEANAIALAGDDGIEGTVIVEIVDDEAANAMPDHPVEAATSVK